MINVLSVFLVLTTLFTGAVFSSASHDQQDVIVKDGERVVAVEFGKETDGDTKVVISPTDGSEDVSSERGTEKETVGTVGAVKEKLATPRELVCDALGKCTHKLAKVLKMSKHVVSERSHDVLSAKEAMKETTRHVGEAKDKLSEKVPEKLETFGEKAKEVAGGAKAVIDSVTEKAKELVKDSADKVMNFDVVDSPKRMGEDIERNATGKVEQEAKETVTAKSLGEILRSLREVIYDVLLYVAWRTEEVMGFVHLLGFSTAYGMCVWVSFFSSYILERSLPKQQFGMVKGKLFAVYLRAMGYCVGAAVMGYVMSQWRKGSLLNMNMMEMFQGFNLVYALLMVVINMNYLEPRANKVMLERMKIEKEEGRGGDRDISPAKGMKEEEVKRLNTYSAAMNVSMLVVLTWHMAYMGHRLR